jgi:hypothetical protein
MHRGLPCSKEKLESAMLHEVVPEAPLQQLPSLVKKPPMLVVPTCDDMPIYEYKGFDQDLNLHHLIKVPLLGFIFFLDRT